MDTHGIPGWDKVDRLAEALANSSGVGFTDSQAAEIERLYRLLDPYDLQPLPLAIVHSSRPSTSRFCRTSSKRFGQIGMQNMKRFVQYIITVASVLTENV